MGIRQSESGKRCGALAFVREYVWNVALFIPTLLTAFAVVLGLVALIFAIRPRKAFVHAELENTECGPPTWTARELIADLNGATLTGSITAIVKPEDADSVAINLSGFAIDGMTVDEDATLMLTPADERGMGAIFLGGDISEVQCPSASVADYSSMNNGMAVTMSHTVLSKAPTFFSQDAITISFSESTRAFICYADGKDLPIDNNVRTLTLRGASVDNTFSGEYEPAGDPAKEEYRVSVFTGLSLEVTSNNPSASLAVFLPQDALLKSAEVNNLATTSSGKLSVSYTPDPEEYELHGQELDLASSDCQLTCVYEGMRHTLSCSGYVQSASISGMDLFPDFWNWYYSNSYIAPFTIISSVIAAHAQFTSHRRERSAKRDSQT